MKIHAISNAAKPPRIDLKQFARDLQKLSARYDLKLMSLGAVATLEAASEGRMYLAMWSAKTDKD